MGSYRIIIQGVGGHGVDRQKASGETVDFKAAGEKTPDAIASECIAQLQAAGESITEATITHWPGTDSQVLDNLLSGKRAGSF